MRISDWSSDVCSSDLVLTAKRPLEQPDADRARQVGGARLVDPRDQRVERQALFIRGALQRPPEDRLQADAGGVTEKIHRSLDQSVAGHARPVNTRSEEHKSELQ